MGTNVTVERVPRDSLRPWERNSRKHSDAQIERLQKSLAEFGFVKPIIADEAGRILAGHGVWMAAGALGMEEVPVLRQAGLSEAQKRAYVIADNKLAELSSWDQDVVGIEMRDLVEVKDLDLGAMGFSVGELRKLTDSPVSEPPASKTVPERTRLGEVWLLGRHRLVVGDCTDPEVVALANGGLSPGLMVTDPPYGVNYDPAWRQQAAEQGHLAYAPISISEVASDDRADWGAAWELFGGDVVYAWTAAGPLSIESGRALQRSGFVLRMQIIWVKSNFPVSRGHYHVRHEPCWYAVRAGARAAWCGSRNETTVWEVPHERFVSDHPTQKPVELMRRAVRNHLIDVVYDPFLGTGSTLIAAEAEDRTCVAIELESKWADVAIARWESFTGLEASRA